MTNKHSLIKKIIYRSTHRGTKEMDLLLGEFVKKNINILSSLDLADLNNLLNMEDNILTDWLINNNQKKIPLNRTSKMLKNFKL